MLAEIRLRAEGLRVKTVYVVLYVRPAGEAAWTEAGATETDFSDSPDPNFSRAIVLPYSTEEEKSADVKLELRRRDSKQKLMGATGFAMVSMASEPTHRLRLRIVGESSEQGHLLVYGQICRAPPAEALRPGRTVVFDVSIPYSADHNQLGGPSKKRRYFYVIERLFLKTNEYLPVYVSEVKRSTTPFVPAELTIEAACLYDPGAKLRFKWMLHKPHLRATSSSKTSVELFHADITPSVLFDARSHARPKNLALSPVVSEPYKFKFMKCALTVSYASRGAAANLPLHTASADTKVTLSHVEWISA